MRTRTTALVLAASIVTGIAACITVNIYFPAPQVRAAAEEIVEETWGQSPRAEPVEPEEGAAPGGAGAWLRALGPAVAHAQGQADVNVSTAAIRALKAAMKQRAVELKPYLAKGAVGIGNDGMLRVRSLDGLALAAQAQVRRLVQAENGDRQELYEEIAEANGYERARIADIQKIFAETWIDKAESGWPVQRPDGSWTSK